MQTLLRLLATLLAFTISCQAASFTEASKYLDTDGSFVGYIDFEGDGQEIGVQLNSIYADAIASIPGMMPIPIDFPTLFENLGFGSIRAMGISSKQLESGAHANRSVVLLNGDPTGLMALYGTKESPVTSFTAAELAPADASSAISGSVQLDAIRDTVVAVLTQVMGPLGETMAQTQLTQVIPGTDITADEVIQALSGRWDAFWLETYDENFMPSYKAWLQIEGAASVAERLQPLAADLPIIITDTKNGLIADLSPMLGIDGIGLYLETSTLDNSLTLYTHEDWGPDSEGPRLSSTENYQALTKDLPKEAIMYSYTAGYDLGVMLAAFQSEPAMAPYAALTEKVIDLVLGDFMEPAVAAMYFEENALVTESYAGYSTKQAVAILPAAVGGGLMAAMAIPAFNKVRETSREKTIINNLRQIASASQQRMLEYGVSEVRYSELIGEDGYMNEIIPVAGESYEDIVITETSTSISVQLPDGRVVTYEF